MVYKVTLIEDLEEIFEPICENEDYLIGNDVVYYSLFDTLSSMSITNNPSRSPNTVKIGRTERTTYEGCSVVGDDVVYIEPAIGKSAIVVSDSQSNVKYRTEFRNRLLGQHLMGAVKRQGEYVFVLGYEINNGAKTLYVQKEEGNESNFINILSHENAKISLVLLDDELLVCSQDSDEDVFFGIESRVDYSICPEVEFDGKTLQYVTGKIVCGDTTYLTYRDKESTVYLVELTRQVMLPQHVDSEEIPEIEPSFVISNPSNINCELVKVSGQTLYFCHTVPPENEDGKPYHTIYIHQLLSKVKSARK